MLSVSDVRSRSHRLKKIRIVHPYLKHRLILFKESKEKENKNTLLQLYEGQEKINVGQTASIAICVQEQRTNVPPPPCIHQREPITYFFIFINIRHTVRAAGARK